MGVGVCASFVSARACAYVCTCRDQRTILGVISRGPSTLVFQNLFFILIYVYMCRLHVRMLRGPKRAPDPPHVPDLEARIIGGWESPKTAPGTTLLKSNMQS